MKILHVARSVNLQVGGPAEGMRQLARVASSAGHQVHFVSLDDPSEPFISSFPFPITILGPGKAVYGYSAKLVPWLKSNIEQFDVVVVHGLWQYQTLGTWRVLGKHRVPYLVFTHGMLDPWFKRTYPLKHLKKWLYWPWAEYRALRDAAAVLFTCDEERLLARQSFRLYSANEKVVPYGSTGPIGNAEEHRKTFFSQYPQLSGKRIAVCMGRIHRKKGCDIAIRAFAQELAADPAWQLMFCGPDQTGWQAELESLAGTLGVQDRVTWTGMLKGDLKWGALRASEIFFLPSHQENFGIVVAEALSCGLPVLISNKINIWREIAADEGGLVGDDTLDGASSLLRQWVALPGSDQETMRRRALECFSNHFEMQRSGHAWVTLLQQVIAERRHRNTAGAFQPAV